MMASAANTAGRSTHLSRELIIDAALKIAEQEGVDSLSIRKVALRLGVTPMALYKHFSNKDELLSFALEAFIVRADVIPDADLHWEEWLLRVGRRMYDALCSDYSWVPILGSVRVGVEAARVTDAFINKLSSAGFTTGQAVQAYFSVIQTVLGAVCLRSSMESADAADGEQQLSNLARAYLETPSLERIKAAPELERVARMDQIDIGLPMIVDALRNRLMKKVD